MNENAFSESASPADTPGLSLTSLTMLVIASMIGAGVYTTSGFALADLGSPNWVMVAWAIGGVIALCGAIGYGELASRLCDNGGEYLYLSRWVHPLAGFIAGWVSLLAGFTGAGALAAVTFQSYVMPSSGDDEGGSSNLLALALVAVCTGLHCLPRLRGVIGQNVLVICKLAVLATFVMIAWVCLPNWAFMADDSAASQAAPGLLALATSVMWISLSYCGFNASIYVAGEASGGSRAVARSMILAVLIVSVFYGLLNAAFVYGPPLDQAIGQKNIASVAATAIGGANLGRLVQIAIGLGLASSVSSVLVAGPRVYARMARDGVFPRWFDTTDARRMVCLQGLLMAVVVSIADLRELLSYLSLTLSLCAAATVATLLWKRPSHSGKTGSSWSLAAAGMFVVATLIIAALTAWHKPIEAQAAGWTLVSGVVVYLIQSKWKTAGKTVP